MENAESAKKGRCIKFCPGQILRKKEGNAMKEDEKKGPDWEVKDPKPPVIRSGHFENKRANKTQ